MGIQTPTDLGWWVYPLLYGNNGSWLTLAHINPTCQTPIFLAFTNFKKPPSWIINWSPKNRNGWCGHGGPRLNTAFSSSNTKHYISCQLSGPAELEFCLSFCFFCYKLQINNTVSTSFGQKQIWPNIGVSKNRWFSPQIIHWKIGFSMKSTIHFGKTPYFWFNIQIYNNKSFTKNMQERICLRIAAWWCFPVGVGGWLIHWMTELRSVSSERVMVKMDEVTRKKTGSPTFHWNTGCLIGIHIMVYHIPT